MSWKITGSYQGKNCFRDLKAVLFSPSGEATKKVSLEKDGSVSFQ